jgi:hypothetical protein
VAVLRAQIADINRPTGWIELDASDGPEATVTAGRAAVGAA